VTVIHDSAMPSWSLPLSRLRIRHFQLIDALDRLGSLRQAALELGVTQAGTLSLIEDLEHAFGTALVSRDHSGTTLSPAGRAVLGRIRVALQEVLLARDLATRGAAAGGVVKVGASPYLIAALLPPVLGHLRTELPSIQIEVREGTISALVEQLNRGEVDAVLGSVDSGTVLASGGALETTFLFSENMCIVAGQGHCLFDSPFASTSALTGGPWVLPPAASHIRGLVDAAVLAQGIPPFVPQIECRGLMQLLEFAASGAMLTVAPRSEAQKLEWRGRVSVVNSDVRITAPPYVFVARRYLQPLEEVVRLRESCVHIAQAMFGPDRSTCSNSSV
jgi:LysR family transcriptional regulator, regulator of abg operon